MPLLLMSPHDPAASSYDLQVVENTPENHNVVVCTLCSCYPVAVLGLSPPWFVERSYDSASFSVLISNVLNLIYRACLPLRYKSRAYRARAVREPRRLLAEEFGLRYVVPPAVPFLKKRPWSWRWL